MHFSRDLLNSNSSVDFTRRRGAIQMPTAQSRDINRLRKFDCMDENTVSKARRFVARMKEAPTHPNTFRATSKRMRCVVKTSAAF